MSPTDRSRPLLNIRSIAANARHKIRCCGRHTKQTAGTESSNVGTCVYLPLYIFTSILCVCGLVILTNGKGLRFKSDRLSFEKTSLSFYEIVPFSSASMNTNEHNDEATALTEDDFVSASRVSPWSYLESKNTQEKQATITLNTILRPHLLDERNDSSENEVSYVFDEFNNKERVQVSNEDIKQLKTDASAENLRPKAAIIYLLNPKKCCVIDSIQLLFENFNRQFRYPVKILHETDITSEAIVEMLKPVLKQDEITLLSTHLIEFSMPPNMTQERFSQFRETAEPPLDKLKRFKIGYSHMIRFFFREIFNRADMKEIEYFWRLDTDSYVTSAITYDLFQHMKDNNHKYGFMGSSFDPLKVTVGMPELFQNYMDTHNDVSERVSRNLHLWKNGTHLKGEYKKMTGVWPFRTSQPIIYNNFEIVHVPTFKSNSFERFIDAVDKTNNIYWMRWGDAALRFFEIMAFLDVEKDIHCFVSDFGYKHQNYKSLPKHLETDPFYANFTIPSKRVV